MNKPTRIIELDKRRRAALGKIGDPNHTHYLATATEDGVITMDPVVIVPARVWEAIPTEAIEAAEPESQARPPCQTPSNYRHISLQNELMDAGWEWSDPNPGRTLWNLSHGAATTIVLPSNPSSVEEANIRSAIQRVKDAQAKDAESQSNNEVANAIQRVQAMAKSNATTIGCPWVENRLTQAGWKRDAKDADIWRKNGVQTHVPTDVGSVDAGDLAVIAKLMDQAEANA